MESDEARAETLAELDEHIFLEIVEKRPVDKMAMIVQYMNVDDQANLLSELPEELKEALLKALHPQDVPPLDPK